jgi:DNA replication and repair protein RecF
MQIKNIKLTNFRNHKSFETGLESGTTILTGPNAIGKTNIIEALHMLSTAKSFRAKYDRDVIKHGFDYTRIEGFIENQDDGTALELYIQKNPQFENASVKKAKVNKVPKSLNNFTGVLNTVLFSPEDIDVITGSPTGRRRYMDSILYQVSSGYRRIHTEYLQAIRHRNKILEKIRETGKGYDELGYWNTKVVQNGISIQNDREKMFGFLKERLKRYGRELNGSKTLVDLLYKKSEISFDRLHEYRNKEIGAVSTLIGPHRDDFEIALDSFNLAEFGSRGQQRAVILALKLSEIDFFVDVTEKRPVLLLDDIFSELDEKHESAVLEMIKLQQTIITATHLPQKLPENTSVIQLKTP